MKCYSLLLRYFVCVALESFRNKCPSLSEHKIKYHTFFMSFNRKWRFFLYIYRRSYNFLSTDGVCHWLKGLFQLYDHIRVLKVKQIKGCWSACLLILYIKNSKQKYKLIVFKIDCSNFRIKLSKWWFIQSEKPTFFLNWFIFILNFKFIKASSFHSFLLRIILVKLK